MGTTLARPMAGDEGDVWNGFCQMILLSLKKAPRRNCFPPRPGAHLLARDPRSYDVTIR